MDLRHWLDRAVTEIEDWQRGYGDFQRHPSLAVDDDAFGAAFAELTGRLGDNYPFFHPRYAGQMLKPPHPAAVVGYLAAMLINPNNHALDGGPATAAMEKEVVGLPAAMFGYREHLGHLTSSGTIANLEALYVARQSHPGRQIAHSSDSHYTHARMCGVLGVQAVTVPVDAAGRMALGPLESLLRTGRIGTVVCTAGSTGLGAVDPIHLIVPLARAYGARVHVDAAYGGFFTLLADARPALIDPAPWRAIADADSVVVDPHKHGLQPYGCGAVLFRDPEVGRFYAHDSPYTYFTSDELHLGEISLECSRAGAAAAALWLTLRLLPLSGAGLGAVLAAGRRAALSFADLVAGSTSLRLYRAPELYIVCYYPAAGTPAAVDVASAAMLASGMAAADPVYLSTLRVDAASLRTSSAREAASSGAASDDAASGDAPPGQARVLRSVLMKPEHEDRVAALHARIEALAADALRSAAPDR